MHRVVVSPEARRSWLRITDRRIRQKIYERAEGLSRSPEAQGKALGEELKGLRSVRAVGQRYRIVYRVLRPAGVVEIVAAGIRREGSREDVYALAAKLIRQGLV